jgi:hypothetical protein
MCYVYRQANTRIEEIKWASLKILNVTPPPTKYIVESRAVYRQRLGKHVTAETDTHAEVNVVLETVCYTRSVQGCCKEDN